MPSEPVSMAARSERMSPNRLPVTITSNCLGFLASCMAQLSAYMWVSSTSGYSASCRAVMVWRQSRPLSMTLAFSTLQTRPWRLRARSKATRPTRSISRRGVDLGVDAALGAVGQGLNAARLAEIDAADAFAHDHDVQAAHQFGLQRAAIRPARRTLSRGADWRTRASSLRRRSRPASGRMSKGTVSHFGPPTEPNSTASAASARATVASVTGTPCASIEAPPTRSSVISKLRALLVPAASPARAWPAP